MIRIQIPATSANLGSGFDSLGIALTMYNQVWMEESDTLDISSKDDVKIPTDENNLIFWAARQVYEKCGRKLPGLKLIQQNDIPMARGLGSQLCLHCGRYFRSEPPAGKSPQHHRIDQPGGGN